MAAGQPSCASNPSGAQGTPAAAPCSPQPPSVPSACSRSRRVPAPQRSPRPLLGPRHRPCCPTAVPAPRGQPPAPRRAARSSRRTSGHAQPRGAGGHHQAPRAPPAAPVRQAGTAVLTAEPHTHRRPAQAPGGRRRRPGAGLEAARSAGRAASPRRPWAGAGEPGPRPRRTEQPCSPTAAWRDGVLFQKTVRQFLNLVSKHGIGLLFSRLAPKTATTKPHAQTTTTRRKLDTSTLTSRGHGGKARQNGLYLIKTLRALLAGGRHGVLPSG